MHRVKKTTNDPTAKVGISENASACKQNIAKNTPRPPIMSDSTGQRSRPTASDAEMMATKAAAGVAEAPPREPAITLASERMARPAVVLRKNTAHSAYSCEVLRASRNRHGSPPPFLVPSAPGEASAGPTFSAEYLTSKAAPPMTGGEVIRSAWKVSSGAPVGESSHDMKGTLTR